jgi:hypothetical protein
MPAEQRQKQQGTLTRYDKLPSLILRFIRLPFLAGSLVSYEPNGLTVMQEACQFGNSPSIDHLNILATKDLHVIATIRTRDSRQPTENADLAPKEVFAPKCCTAISADQLKSS